MLTHITACWHILQYDDTYSEMSDTHTCSFPTRGISVYPHSEGNPL